MDTTINNPDSILLDTNYFGISWPILLLQIGYLFLN